MMRWDIEDAKGDLESVGIFPTHHHECLELRKETIVGLYGAPYTNTPTVLIPRR